MGWIIFILATIGWHIGMYGMFKKAGITPWKALIPFYNTWLIVEKCQIKKYWFWLQFIPIAGQFITIWITIIFTMHFGKFNVLHHTLVVLLPFVYFPYLGFSKNEKWKGHEIFKLYRKPGSREWVDAIVFAVVAATIIRGFIFEAFVIPTGSMEKTLRINDFLFVNKLSYGPRIPITPLSFPFVHNTLPGSATTPSYLKWIQIPYKRLPGFGEVKRNDVVVFNFPAGDTIINLPEYGSARPYYDVLREGFKGDREALLNQFPIIVHPIDKTDNYIKRCVAVSGDTIEIKAGNVYINNALTEVAPDAESDYIVTTNGTTFDEDFLKKDLLVWMTEDDNLEYRPLGNNQYYFNIRATDIEKIKALKNVVNVVPAGDSMTGPAFVWPYDTLHKWSRDDFGKLWIPKAGANVTLSAENIALYRRIITNYEGHTLTENNNTYTIDGKPATTYTFKYNYYWMMGDNRHRSQDSRYWGFVPETHIVGRASFVWFSWEGGPRWSRIFRSIK